jgi:hypothetical protein
MRHFFVYGTYLTDKNVINEFSGRVSCIVPVSSPEFMKAIMDILTKEIKDMAPVPKIVIKQMTPLGED